MKRIKIIPSLVAILLFSLASIIYFHPILKGHKLNQSDITQFRGMVKDINDFRSEENREPYWTYLFSSDTDLWIWSLLRMGFI